MPCSSMRKPLRVKNFMRRVMMERVRSGAARRWGRAPHGIPGGPRWCGRPHRARALTQHLDLPDVFGQLRGVNLDREKCFDDLDVGRGVERGRGCRVGAAAGERHRDEDLVGEVLADGRAGFEIFFVSWITRAAICSARTPRSPTPVKTSVRYSLWMSMVKTLPRGQAGRPATHDGGVGRDAPAYD
jgi:hypothetical protein